MSVKLDEQEVVVEADEQGGVSVKLMSSQGVGIQMTHRLEWISAEWMHELTLEQFKPTSAASGF